MWESPATPICFTKFPSVKSPKYLSMAGLRWALLALEVLTLHLRLKLVSILPLPVRKVLFILSYKTFYVNYLSNFYGFLRLILTECYNIFLYLFFLLKKQYSNNLDLTNHQKNKTLIWTGQVFSEDWFGVPSITMTCLVSHMQSVELSKFFKIKNPLQ